MKNIKNTKNIKNIKSLKRKINIKIKYMNKQLDRSYNYFINTSAALPNYIIRNLKNLPNNKGYRWRDICFFGELPDENNNKTTIYEKKNNKLYIHLYNDGKYNVIEKNIEDKIDNKKLDEQLNKKLNKQSNEKSNRQPNEQSNKQSNKKLNRKSNEQSNKKLNEQSNKKLNEQSNKKSNEQSNKKSNEQLNKPSNNTTKNLNKNKFNKKNKLLKVKNK